MTKREYILFILNDLKWVWNLAEPFLVLVDKIDKKDDKLLNSLYILLKKNIENINDKKVINIFNENKRKLKKSLLDEKNQDEYDNMHILDMEKELNII